MDRLFLGMPLYCSQANAQSVASMFRAQGGGDRFAVVGALAKSSLLCKSFNDLYAQALSDPANTHFVMLHADVVPPPQFLNTLYDECCRLEADLVSAVSPLKDASGKTSTAIDNPNSLWKPRRLTLHEIWSLPETFSFADCQAAGLDQVDGTPGCGLLVNTACFLVDLRKPWARELDPDTGYLRRCFLTRDAIGWDATSGQYVPLVASEDWNFSRMLNMAGAKIYATRKVPLRHVGEIEYSTFAPWGSERSDGIDIHGCWVGRHADGDLFDESLAAAIAARAVPRGPIVDLGCGLGRYVKYFCDAGAACAGFDGNPETRKLTGGFGQRLDLAVPQQPEETFPTVVCLEVGEHVPAEFEDVFLDNLCRFAGQQIILSWAVPGQPGDGHVNCRDNQHVIERMRQRGWELTPGATQVLRTAASLPYFKQTLMVFMPFGAN